MHASAEIEGIRERGKYAWDRIFQRHILHVIQPGDNLFNLAQRYCVDVDAIVMANPCADPDNLQVGQIVIIPCSPRPRRDDPDYYAKK